MLPEADHKDDDLKPIRVEITVPVEPEYAFEVFTNGFGNWWPTDSHSLARENCKSVEINPGLGGKIVEHAKGRDPVVWGTVDIWQAGEHVAFTWHPGWEEGAYTRISVTFEQNAFGRCVIRLKHWDWKNLGEIAPMVRDGYESGWKYVFEQCFANYLTAKRH